jgi:hypothetical protein
VYTFVLVAWLTRVSFCEAFQCQQLRQGLNHCHQEILPKQGIRQRCISYCGGSIETAVDALKGPDCGNATKETEKDAKVENAEYVDKDTNDLEHDGSGQIITRGSKQPDEDTTDETGEDDKADDNEV